ncbi:protocadherin-15-like [Mizuhopecten yessoensis]|uniref:Cadherin EGF LAG seven-pass G-type receptor 3 n=1 Tax=Mizuhopecten yessoensis TaxID=6573 RepID=A0A210QGK3_MIZYE|nr:protocadherin-15-like [Mizuhopecten yessoensis]XP_021358621.1 protocadherin-15-like [Mizuhopecten yessoensis]XP_021358622.1 protocadherin-15-like [Mizuhopecten yessoensis]XP_021358623.1 protocadherin-15-like [Mizuhopecten yessoensis]XP_021358624.1 protocadherin-15-like [Mizuhopecten yessoensis]OWF47885.1 Cadherin EGF LAG seven-pass G-type receptor 3 [Mizuhopecten yessoensis]
MDILVVILGILAAVDTANTQDPCSISEAGYESFITDVPEDTPVGSVLGTLNVLGGPDTVDLSQQSNTYLLFDTVSRNITLQVALDTDQGTGTITLLVNCRIINEVGMPLIPLTVRVILEDVNDNSPIFSSSNYVFNVTEDTAVGTTIFNGAIATDADQRGGGNDQISYRILPGTYSDYFDIEYPLYPDIKLKKPFDFETLNTVTVEIEAKDNPERGVSMSSSATLTINVVDVDDLSPTFTFDFYTGNVHVNATRGTVVKIYPPIKAQDQDQLNTPVIYYMLDPKNRFIINEITGEITVESQLSETTYAAILEAVQRDNPLRYGTALVTIAVSGYNASGPDGPSFQQNLYETTISESQPSGTTVMTVPVTVTNPLTTLSYTILESIQEFAVDQRGNIFLVTPLDYDGPDKEYRFTLQVSDGINVASTSIHIRVADVNDNTPELRNDDYVVETERVQGAIITVIEGSDRDINTQLQYQLKTFTSFFAINSQGDISITASPEELLENSYRLVVSVSDDGIPPRSTVALVTVKFPPLGVGVTQPQGEMADDLLAIIMGAVAAVLFVIIVILIVYIIRRRVSFTDEQLTKARLHDGLDPKGLTYKPGDPSPDPVEIDMKFDGDLEETSDIDGATTIQDNPLSDDRMNYGFSNHSNDGSGEIQLDTAVIPYGNSFHNYEDRHTFQNGMLKTFHVPEGSSSGESSNSDSTGDSNRGLMKIRPHKSSSLSKGKTLSWGDSNDRGSSEETLPKELRKSKDKPEITVYF